MEKKRFKILWWLIPFLILLSGLLFPSCGFIGLLFDGDDGGDNTKFFDLTMSYNYSGFRTVSTTSPMVLLFIPLDDNFQFPDGQLNMGEAYAFYNMKEFVGSVPQPDYINVDSSIETWIPHFELNDSFFMDGFVVFSPLDGETVYGEGPSLIRVVGLQIEPMIRTIEIRIDAILQGTFPADQEVFLVNMSLYPDGPHTLDITAYDKDMIQVFFDQPPLNMPVNFNYVAP
jgi:hypothetical protein